MSMFIPLLITLMAGIVVGITIACIIVVGICAEPFKTPRPLPDMRYEPLEFDVKKKIADLEQWNKTQDEQQDKFFNLEEWQDKKIMSLQGDVNQINKRLEQLEKGVV